MLKIIYYKFMLAKCPRCVEEAWIWLQRRIVPESWYDTVIVFP
jgi:hypothetical protein